jgi:hypothetical protein
LRLGMVYWSIILVFVHLCMSLSLSSPLFHGP